MAQVDPNIAMGFRPIQIESPVNQMRALYDVQNARQQQEMNALRMQELQRGTEQRNALARIHSDPNVEVGSEAYFNRVAAEAPDLFEGVANRALQRENLAAQREERTLRTQEREQKLSKEQLDTAIADIASFDTLDDIQTDIQRKVAEGKLKTEYADRIISGLPTNDAEVPAWQLRTLRSLLSAKDRLTEQREQTRVSNEEKRLKLEDDRVRETQRHQKAMEEISASGVDRQQRQLEETRRHNQAMEGLDARRVNITAAAEARKAEQGESPLSLKDKQKREAAYPQANAAIQGIEAKAESFINDLKALRDHPGLSQITGILAGRVSGLTKEGRAAQALYDKILAKGGFEMLQQMREASKTGGALGNVSNQEGKQLQASFAAIDRRQDAEDVKKALETAISDVEGAKARSREAFSETYSYREQRDEGKGADTSKLSPVDRQALDWANANPKDPRAAQIKQRLGVK